MDNALMLRRQREQRAGWLELDEPPRRALQIRRPSEDQVASWRGAMGPNSGLQAIPQMRKVAQLVVIGWRGFTEADLLGPEIGASDEQPFNAEVFAEWVDDETETLVNIAGFAVKSFSEHRDKKAAAEKN